MKRVPPLISSALRCLKSSWRSLGSAAEAPRERLDLPANALIYAVGDVHGCHDELVRLEEKMVADGGRVPGEKFVIMLGDYVDRGPHSAAVLEHLTRSLPAGFTRLCLCGNHEQMMLRFLDDPLANLGWLDYGGGATMRSYGLDVRWLIRTHADRPKELRRLLLDAVPGTHVEFLRALPVLVRAGNVVFVHAGLRPGVPLARQSDMDLLWMREPFLSEGPQLPVIVIHGHTPTDRPKLVQNRLCADTRAYATGRLTAVRCHQQTARLLVVERN